MSNLNKTALMETLHTWIAQRPGLDFADYGDVSCYRSESRRITGQRHDAEAMLAYIAWHDSITAEMIVTASASAFSGRLEITPSEDGQKFKLSYCTGQYWPTEYRAAACAVLASAIWYWLRGNLPKDCEHMGDAIRKNARRELGRNLASRWFN